MEHRRLAIIRELLQAETDPDRAKAAQAYMKSSMPSLGVKVPAVRRIVLARTWASDPDFWIRRAAITSQLKAKTSTDQGLLATALDANLADKEFFIRKAIGWTLREYAKTNPQWVRSYVETRQARLSPLSRREAMKHLE